MQFTIDTVQTFSQLVLLDVEPKREFGSEQQRMTRDGIPQWTVTLVGAFRRFDRTDRELFKVTVASHANPLDTTPALSPVEVRGLTAGVYLKGRGDNQTAETWFSAEEIRSTASTGRKLSPVTENAS